MSLPKKILRFLAEICGRERQGLRDRHYPELLQRLLTTPQASALLNTVHK